MNVNVLETNPDWRWYVLIGAGSLILTMIIWIVLGYFDVSNFIPSSGRQLIE